MMSPDHRRLASNRNHQTGQRSEDGHRFTMATMVWFAAAYKNTRTIFRSVLSKSSVEAVRFLSNLKKSRFRFLLRSNPPMGRQPTLVLVSRLSLGPRQSLAVVEAQGMRFLVSTTSEGSTSMVALSSQEENDDHIARSTVAWTLPEDSPSVAGSFPVLPKPALKARMPTVHTFGDRRLRLQKAREGRISW